MLDRSRKEEALRQALSQTGKTKGDEIVFFCPKHGANPNRRDGQLSVNVVYDTFHCWSCGFSGRNLVPLLRTRGMTQFCREYIADLEQRPGGTRCVVLKVEDSHVYDAPKLPREFVSLTQKSGSPARTRALSYLASRGLDADDLYFWKLGFAESGELGGRIVIPSFDSRGLLNYVVGRSFTGDEYRYKPLGRLTKNIVWNEHMIDWSAPLYVTEGPFDAFVIRENVTILNGTFFPKALLARIVLEGTPVVLAMDADAYARQLDHIELLISYGIDCSIIDIRKARKKDVGSISRKDFYALPRIHVRNELDLMRVRIMTK